MKSDHGFSWHDGKGPLVSIFYLKNVHFLNSDKITAQRVFADPYNCHHHGDHGCHQISQKSNHKDYNANSF